MKRKNLCIWLATLSTIGLLAGCNESSGNSEQVSCTANEVKCAGEDQFKTCGSNGEWGNPQSCPKSTPVCDSSKNACVEGAITNKCTEGATRCDGANKFQTCTDGSWSDSETCPASTPTCDGQQNKCVGGGEHPVTTCVEGRTLCTDNKHMKTCTNKKWEAAVECPSETPVCVESLQKCVECIPDDKKCISEDQYHICREYGTWGSAVTCQAPNGICSETQNDCIEGTPATTCTDGETRCNNEKTIETCNNGIWTPTACPNNKPFCDSSINQCVVCIPGVNICEVGDSGKYAVVYQCTEDRKKTQLKDGNGFCGQELCNEAATACKCTDGIRMCFNDNEVKVCKNGNWETEHSCADNEICYNLLGSVCIPNETGLCSDGESICGDELLYECKDGLYVGHYQGEDDCDESGCELIKYFCITTNITKGSRRAHYSKKECKNAAYCKEGKQYYCDAEGKRTEEACPSTTGTSPHCVIDGTASNSGDAITTTKCINSKNNFVLTCEGDDLYYNLSDTERTKLVNCKDYGLKCIPGNFGFSIPGYYGSGGCGKK